MAVVRDRVPRERSKIRELHTAPAEGEPYTVWPDVRLTRRKRHHIITRSDGEAVFRSRWWSDVTEWLLAEGVERYRLVTDRGTFAVTVVPDQGKKEA